MQTFLPYPDFRRSARTLDSRRLGKQRVEAYQILRTLAEPNRWSSHPVVHMWRGYEEALAMYMNVMIEEWIERGFRNNMKPIEHIPDPPMPPWLGDPRLHISHQSNLVRKEPQYYRPLFPDVPDDLPYFWPTKEKPYKAT